MASRNVVIAIVVLIVLGLIAWVMLGNTASLPVESTTTGTVSPSPAPPSAASTTGSAQTAPKTVTVVYTDQGYSPKNISVPVGTTVTFVNQSARSSWVASDEHPTHLDYDSNSKNTHCAVSYAGPAPFDACRGVASGSSWSFTFTKAGSWTYHDHLNASQTGTVTVTGTGVNVNASL